MLLFLVTSSVSVTFANHGHEHGGHHHHGGEVCDDNAYGELSGGGWGGQFFFVICNINVSNAVLKHSSTITYVIMTFTLINELN